MTARRLITLGSLVALIAVWAVLFRPAAMGGATDYVIVSGHSMEPTMYTGDLAVVREHDTYEKGDIVAFNVEGGAVIHRIIGGNAEDGYVMQGDNKPAPDDWQPTPDEIRGSLWLHVPGGGRWFERAREPLNLAFAITGVGMMSFIPWRRKPDGAPRFRRRRSASSSGVSLPGARAPLPLVGALLATAALALALGALATAAFLDDTEHTVFVERARYTHTLAYDFTAEVQPTTLNPGGRIGPIAPPPPVQSELGGEVTTTITQPPIFTKLARTMDLGFAYALGSDEPVDVTGEYSVELRITRRRRLVDARAAGAADSVHRRCGDAARDARPRGHTRDGHGHPGGDGVHAGVVRGRRHPARADRGDRRR